MNNYKNIFLFGYCLLILSACSFSTSEANVPRIESIESISYTTEASYESEYTESEPPTEVTSNVTLSDDYNYLESMGIFDTLEKVFTLNYFTAGIYSSGSFEFVETMFIDGNPYNALIIPKANNNAVAISKLENLFGDLQYNEQGYYECPIKSLDEYLDLRNGFYTGEYLERQREKANNSSIDSLIEANGILYFYSGAGYVGTSNDYETSRIIEQAEDEILIEIDYDSKENDISYKTTYRFKNENDLWKIDEIIYDSAAENESSSEGIQQTILFRLKEPYSYTDNEMTTILFEDEDLKNKLDLAIQLKYGYIDRTYPPDFSFSDECIVEYAGINDRPYCRTNIDYNSFIETFKICFTDKCIEELFKDKKDRYINDNGTLMLEDINGLQNSPCNKELTFEISEHTEEQLTLHGRAKVYHPDNPDEIAYYDYYFLVLMTEQGWKFDTFDNSWLYSTPTYDLRLEMQE